MGRRPLPETGLGRSAIAKGGSDMKQHYSYSVSYNAKKRLFCVYRNERKYRTFTTEKAAWAFVLEKQEEARMRRIEA
jgi:hypothetical protein